MKIQNINSNSFRGIQLSENNIKSAKRIVKYLRINGYNCVGKKIYFMQKNDFSDLLRKTKYIRNHYQFDNKEFGVVFFPWARKTYILSEPKQEQTMLEWVKEMDSDAKINLLI